MCNLCLKSTKFCEVKRYREFQKMKVNHFFPVLVLGVLRFNFLSSLMGDMNTQ